MSDFPRALLTAIVTATPQIAALVDADGAIAWSNPAFITRWPCADSPTVDGLLHVVHPDDQEQVESAWDLLRAGVLQTIVKRARLGCGHNYREGHVRFTRVDGPEEIGGVVIHVVDLEPRFVPHGDLDPLTGLANRASFLTEIDNALAGQGPGLVFLLDLDHFHVINESLGYAAGDDVLVTIARRVRDTVHDGDVVARVSADEFGVLCCHDSTDDRDLAGRLRAEVRQPVLLGSGEHVVDCSIGMVPLSVVSGTIEALAAADSAVFLAKSRGRGRVEIFDEGLRDSAAKTLRRTVELRQAVLGDELLLRFQPVVDLHTGRTLGCEALLRWMHPREGELIASEFIDVAETSGLIDAVTERVLVEACMAARRLAQRLQTPGAAAPYVAVNLSPQQLSNPRVVERVDYALQRAGIHPAQLMVEITETTVLHDVQSAVTTLTLLRDRGVRVALDDFGTGYSSLLRLRELPVDCLKIDRAFVSALTHSSDDLAIVASVVNMASTLGLYAIAEGVENDEQVQQLRALGCPAAQGFFWSKAVPLTDVPSDPGIRPATRTAASRTGPTADQHLIDWIMRLHASGASLDSIAAVLNRSGARTAGGRRWHARSVARVVSLAAYPQLGHSL